MDFNMNTTYLEKLEFDKITKMLNNFCCTYIGKKWASQLAPSNQVHDVKKLLQETRRGYSCISSQ